MFNDFVSEIQRSIGFFSSVNREARISKVIGVGNGFKMAGLQKFLGQHLQYEVVRLESFDSVVGDTVLNAGLFQENIMSFVVPYGLALQALDLTKIHSNLLPPEIATSRKIRAKKPWAVTTAATLLFCLAASTAGFAKVAGSLSADRFGEGESKAQQVTATAGDFKTKYDAGKGVNQGLKAKKDVLFKPLDTPDHWQELYKAINECLPRDQGFQRDIKDIKLKNQIKLPTITTKRYPNLSLWFSQLQAKGAPIQYMSKWDREHPPTGAGLVVTLEGVHYHHEENNATSGQGVRYVFEHFLKNLHKWEVQDHLKPERSIPVGKMGISHATITDSKPIVYIDFAPDGKRPPTNPQFGGDPGQPRNGVDGPKVEQIPQTRFTVEFVWKPTLVADRKDLPPSAQPNPNDPNAQPADGQQPGSPPPPQPGSPTTATSTTNTNTDNTCSCTTGRTRTDTSRNLAAEKL